MSTKEKTRLLMEACKGKERDDQSAKSFFHRKDFLANVLKGTVSEYADLTIREIMDCIEGDTIQTGTALVSEDAADTIRGENTQLTTIGEAPVTYDILFRSLIPQFKETIKVNLHIDLEIQQEYSVSYPLERRAIYYAARKISAQLPKVGKNGVGYKYLEKVYSIWICLDDIPRYLQNTISYYKMSNYKTEGIGQGKNSKRFLEKTQKAADLLEVVIIRLGRGNSERGVIDFLTGVFSGNQEIVFSYLPDDITKEEREEVGNMLSLVDYAEKRGEKSGEKRGEKRGKRIGEKRGQKIAESRMQELLQKLIADNRTEDLVKISKDKEHLKKMYKEYGIGEDE